MWLITPEGFFSIVEKASDKDAGTLTVRARVKTDLDALRQSALPTLGPTSVGQGTDYRYRASAPRKAVAAAMARMVEDLHYSNFKNEVAKRQGHARAQKYHDVWDVLYGMQNGSKYEVATVLTTPKGPGTAPKADAYGGVLVNEKREILLVEPLNHFGGYVWTFPKGKPDAGESPQQTALREVREETGYTAEIIGVLPQAFAGSTSKTAYFLMKPLGPPGPLETDETNAVRWASLEEAEGLVALSKNDTGRKRDKAILDAVCAALETMLS